MADNSLATPLQQSKYVKNVPFGILIKKNLKNKSQIFLWRINTKILENLPCLFVLLVLLLWLVHLKVGLCLGWLI